MVWARSLAWKLLHTRGAAKKKKKRREIERIESEINPSDNKSYQKHMLTKQIKSLMFQNELKVIKQ